jgi:S1-C subfamily serine protease
MTPASGTCDETPARATTPAATTPAATTPAATTPAATTPAATTPAATTPAAIKAVITTPQAEAAGLETETKRSTDGDSTPNSYQAEKSELANAKAELVGELEPLEQPELANAKAELVGESEPLEQPELATAKAELVGESEPLEQPELAAAPAERASEVVQVNLASRAAYRLTWCLTLLGFLLVLVSGLPLLVEELQYRLERGRLRARVESAGRWLDQAPLGEFSRASEMVSQRVGPSVVHINIADESGEEEAAARDRAGSENLLDENGLPRRRPRRRLETGQGSGVVMDSEGHIVTNRHVIEDAKRIEVVLSDGRRRPAIIVGVDEPTDIAVLKVDAPGVFAAEWGDSDSLEVGALVWAVGSPFGLERSITFGILSAKNRAGLAGTPFQDLMQSDAAVNPGNSGGPLVDAQGRVVGINTAIVGAAYQGVSFAIPSQVAERVYRDLKTRGVVARGWLGIEPQTVDEQLARELGLTAEQRGALVRRLADVPLGEDLPARSAGIRLGDVIQSWNGRMVETADGLIANVSQTPVGEKVPVMVLRDGEQLELEVTVGRRPPTPR